jgi:HPr kinase/phosphorylase
VDDALRTGVETVHATAISMDGRAALIRGESGAGKSDLALRCLALSPSLLFPVTPLLVADDRVRLERTGDRVLASAPETIRGHMEVRGAGIIEVPSADNSHVVLVVDLVSPSDVPRMPDPSLRAPLLGVDLPLLRLAPFEASAPIKLLIRLAPRLTA